MYGLEFILPRLRPVHVEIYLLMSWYMWFPHYLILLSDRSSSWIHCCIYVFMPEPSVCLSSGKNPRFCVKHFTLRISFHGIASWQTIALSLLQDLESCFLFSFFFQNGTWTLLTKSYMETFQNTLIHRLGQEYCFWWGVGRHNGARTKTRPFNSWQNVKKRCLERRRFSHNLLYQKYKNHLWSSPRPCRLRWLLWK